MRSALLSMLALLTTIPAIAQQVDWSSGPEKVGIKCRLDASGLPTSLETDGYQWLTGTVRMEVLDEVSKAVASPEGTADPVKDERTHTEAVFPNLGLVCTQEWLSTSHALAWDFTFTGDGKRIGHQVTLTFPILGSALRVFTPSMYGTMDIDKYPNYTPVPYAHFGWESGQAYVLPLITILNEANDTALTIALPADANTPHLQISWTEGRLLRLEMAHRGIGGGRPSSLRLLFFTHPPDYRCALKAYSDEFPRHFKPVMPPAASQAAFWYHHIHDHPDFAEMRRQRVSHIWTSFWFTHLGNYMPDEAEWEPYSFAKWWKLGVPMNDAKINNFIKEMHSNGIGVYAYFNVTEYGGAGGKSGGTEEAAKMLKERFSNALVKNERGDFVPTWEGAMAMNCGKDYSLWPFLQEQINRHIQRVGDIDGFDIDRLDWTSVMDYAHDDGLTMFGEITAENLAVPVGEAVSEICRQMHALNKRVHVNQFYRIEPLKDVDGYVHENDYLPALGFLSPFRYAAAWHMRKPYNDDLLQFEGQLKRRLQWALFPQMIAHEFPISQQPANVHAADMLELYAPLFEQFVGKEQVLEAHCVTVTGANDVNLFRNKAGNYVAPITSRLRFISRKDQAVESVTLTLRVREDSALEWAKVYSPEREPYDAVLQRSAGTITVEVGKHRSASVVVLGKDATTCPRDKDDESLARLRSTLIPSDLVSDKKDNVPPVNPLTARLDIRGEHIGQKGPVLVILNGQSLGRIEEDRNSFTRTDIAISSSATAPTVRLVQGADGIWYVPRRIGLSAEGASGGISRIAEWTPTNAASLSSAHALELPLHWTNSEHKTDVKAAFNEKNLELAGQWKQRYGFQAAWIANVDDIARVQKGFKLELVGGSAFTWKPKADDARVLQSHESTPKPATCWYGNDKIALNVTPPDNNPYLLTLYLLDYDRVQRACEVSLESDFINLDTRSVTAGEMSKGVYLTWSIAGPVEIQILKKSGENITCSGVFIDRKR